MVSRRYVDRLLDAAACNVTAEGSVGHQAMDNVAHVPKDSDDDTEQAETVAPLFQGSGARQGSDGKSLTSIEQKGRGRLRVKKVACGPAPARKLTQYLFKTAHEVVADRGSRQIGCAGASPHIEEVIGAQHGVVFLGVTRGGQYPVHRYRHLAKSHGKVWHLTESLGTVPGQPPVPRSVIFDAILS
ncbi:hypothetical protein N1851_003533 [Merluccius polli]|uniref:Uncharacterized protein n=1 Tax=Merluccius polli TaxID=89951 RepID=A0AA47N8U1_MERPO|nr:hypothetical protein N1851_003533 [Merluccius polli]